MTMLCARWFIPYRWILDYAIAIATPLLALQLTLWVSPLIASFGQGFGKFSLFYLAILISSLGRTSAGVVSLILSLLLIHEVIFPETHPLSWISLQSLVPLGLFLSVAICLILLMKAVQTSKRQLEQRNRTIQADSRDRLSMALSAAQMGMWDWDLLTGVVIWSPEYEQLLGFTPGSFDGRYETFETCVHPDDLARLKQVLAQAIEQHLPYRHEFRVIWADGSIHWVEGRGKVLLDAMGKPIRMLGTVMAVDQRKQAELASQENQEKLNLFIHYAPASIVMFDHEMRYLAASQRWVNELHLGSIENLIGKSHYEVFPNLEDRLKHHHQQGLAGHIQKHEDDYFVNPNGMEQWFRWELHPWYTPDQQVGGIILFAEDITERKLAERSLQQMNAELEQINLNLEARVRDRTAELTRINDHLQQTIASQDRTQRQLWEHAQLLDLAHDTIMTLDLDWVITFWNQGAERLYGWSKAEAVGQKVVSLLHAPSAQSLTAIHNALMEQGFWEGELKQRDRYNQLVIVASRWVLQRDNQGNPLKILKINHDITARKQAEQTLQRYTAEVEDLYNHAPCGYHSLNADGVFVRINDTELEWLGYAREEIVGKQKFTDLITLASQQVFYENFPRFKQQGWINDVEFELVQADGSTRWVSVNATAIRDDTGQMIMSRSTLFDISDRRKTDQIKQDFISVVSHELRTPLTSIRGSLGLLAGGVFDQKPERKQAMIEIAARQSDRLVRLVNDILDLRRLESGKTQFNFSECAMTELMQQSVDTMRSQAEQQSVQITIIPTEAQVWADADAIVQTLTNLLSNAIKFSPAETTIILAATPDPTDLNMVRCLVQDQGRGIPSDHLESIFGQFQQVNASDSRDKGGTGLGLAICRTIIEQHNGRIWAENRAADASGEPGSRFYFTLPIASVS